VGSFQIRGVELWNTIPLDVRKKDTVVAYKTALKNIFSPVSRCINVFFILKFSCIYVFLILLVFLVFNFLYLSYYY